MVSSSTRRLPSTTIEDTVWAAAGDDIRVAVTAAATGTATKIRAPNKPPRTRIPTFMRQAPLLSESRPAPLRTDRFPFVALLVANLAGAANGPSQRNFIFIPRRCPSATQLKKPFTTRPDAGCHYRSQTPSASAPGRARSGTPSPAPVPTTAGRGRLQPRRTGGDRHRAAAPETG